MNTLVINQRFARRFLAAEIGRIWNARAAGMALLCTLGAPAALAEPKGGVVVAGQATIARSGSNTNIDQGSQRAVINWNSFNVAGHESVNFRQPDASSVVLNRVLGNDASAIFGRITANGQVFLVNPNGILFGPGARVDVGGLVASTANLSNANFMAGNMRFDQPGRPGATVRNEGSMTIGEGGFAVLVGRGVANSGLISARLGKIALAGGEAFVLDLYGDRLVNLIVDPVALAGIGDARGVSLGAYVDQSGTVVAEGGRVVLSAATVKSLVDNLINVSGVIRATSVENRAGTISLRGDESTRLALDGTLDASGARAGRIELTARDVALGSGARVEASGREGGGDIAIGGNWQGGGSLAHAGNTSIARGATIKANAIDRGDGGTVAIWSADATGFDGTVEARGGASAGNGGQVEVSGKRLLRFDGDVDASAARGFAGRLLLDPANLIISSTGQATIPGAGAAGDYTVAASALNRQLVRGTSVTLQADQDITVLAGAQIDGRAASGGVAGAGLGFTAGRNIAVDGLVILNNGAFDARAGGSFTQGGASAIATGTGAITIGAAAGVAATNLITNGTVALASSGGAVRVGEALSGLDGTRLGALEARGRDGVTLAKGALVDGATTLAAPGGRVALGATLVSGGAVDISGASTVAVSDIVTPGAVRLTGVEGVAMAGSVGNSAETVSAVSARSQSLTVRSDGAIELGGMALGSGGLLVEGVAGSSRSGTVRFGEASIFSDGGVTVRATGDIRFAGAGIASGGSVLLDSANGAVATGGGLITSGGGLGIVAGTNASVGRGGLNARGAEGLAVSAGETIAVEGVLGSVGSAALGTRGDLFLNTDITAHGVRIEAGGFFRQAATSVLAAGTGAVEIIGTGGISASNIVTTGRVGLDSREGVVKVAGPVSGPNSSEVAQRVAALDVRGRGGVKLEGGALVGGPVMLGSGAGQVDTRGGTIDALGGVVIDGYAGVATSAVFTPASSLVVSSTAGGVSLGVSNAPGDADTSVIAESLAVRNAGSVTLSGARLGPGGMTITSLASNSSAASVNLGNSGITSEGAVAVKASGGITVGAGGISTGSTLVFDSLSGIVATGERPVKAAGDIGLTGGEGIAVGSGGVDTGGSLNVLAKSGNVSASGTLASAGHTISIKANDKDPDKGRVTLGDVSTAAVGGSAGLLEIDAGEVVLGKELGGENSGYETTSPGYQIDKRPAVGRVVITASRDVEVNGLNLDGNDGENDTSSGLSIFAGNIIVSNNLIAVNKGNIELITRATGALDGIYLGNSVYSRGYDRADGKKIGYSISLLAGNEQGAKGNIFLYDNTNDFAALPTSLDSPKIRSIPKIVVANNVANYGVGPGTESSFLVDASNKINTFVRISANALQVLKSAPRALRIDAMPDILERGIELEKAHNTVRQENAGISLKVQVFRAENDSSTMPYIIRSEAECSGQNYRSCGIDSLRGETILAGNVREPTSLSPDSDLPVFRGGQPGNIGFVLRPGNSVLDDAGIIGGFKNEINQPFKSTLEQKIAAVKAEAGMLQEGFVSYAISGRVIQVNDEDNPPVSRILFGPGTLQSIDSKADFDGSANLANVTVPTAGIVGDGAGGASSNPVFPRVGQFQTILPTPIPAGVGGGMLGTGTFGGQSDNVVGAGIGSGVGLPIPPLPEGELISTLLVPQVVDSSDFYVDDSRQEDLLDIALGRRPAAEADMGRGSAASGAALNVFRKRYRIAQALDSKVCAPDDLVVPKARAAGDDRDARACAPAN